MTDVLTIESLDLHVVTVGEAGPAGPAGLPGQAGPPGPGLADGNYGDISVSGAATAFTINSAAVSYAKIQNVSATDKVLGRASVGAGPVEEIACTSLGRSVIASVSALAARAVMGLVIGSDVAPEIHVHAWTDIIGTPTTIAGYGITAVPWASITGAPTTLAGYGIVDAQPLDSDLTAIAALAGTGIPVQTAIGAWAQRSIAGTAARIAVTNGSGVLGNPTVDIDSGYVGQASITTLGTIGTGVWNAGAVTSSGAVQGTRLISTVVTGTAPLSVTSTTLVPNLYVARAALADTVTTNANLAGPITSVGNTASVAAQTGTGSTFVMQASPVLTTPNIGAATGTSLSVTGQLTSTVAIGTAPLAVTSTTKVVNLYADRAALADTVTTNANLTGPITSVGNATAVGAQTGTGNTFVMQASPVLTTPNIGTPSAGVLTSCTGLPISTGVSGLAAGVATFLATPSSANLIAAVTDETGTGALVFANTPTLVTPNIGAATGTSLSLAGLLDLSGAAAGQISFPATQNASAGANTLDDYEEGTWTPVLTFVTPGTLSVAYSVQQGTYTKVGRVIVLEFALTTSTFTLGTATGNCNITGLPYPAVTSTNYFATGAFMWQGITKTGYTYVVPQIASAGSLMTPVANGSGQSFAFVTTTDMPTGGTVAFRGAILYHTA